MLDLMGLDEDKTFNRALAATHFARERRDAFRRELGPTAVEQLERSLAGHLRLWGYS
jgi:hypothetical protein